MKKILLILSTIFICFNLNAQNTGLGSTELDVIRDVNLKQRTQDRMKKSKMNYFLDQEWKGGVVFTNDTLTIDNYLLRYNIYTDQIEYRTVINPYEVNIISIGSQKFVFTDYLNEDSVEGEGYFELLENGNCKLLLRRNIKYSEGRNDIDAYGASSATDVKETLYIKKENAPAVFIDKNKESIKKMFSDEPEMVKYIDDKFVVFVTKKTVHDIVKYYNNSL